MEQKSGEYLGDPFQAFMESPLGRIRIRTDGEAVTEVHFMGKPVRDDEVPPLGYPALLQEAIHQLKAYFEGQRVSFDLPLHPGGTAFQERVWQALQGIPYGQTISYLELARRLGDPKTIRAAASANGRNPIAIIIPCHRVIGSDGSLVGYAGGLPVKKWLLELEKQHAAGPRQTLLFG